MPFKRTPAKNKFNASDPIHTYDMIAKRTGTRSDAVKKFIEDNNLDRTKVMMAVGQRNDPKFDFVTALVGKPNNVYFKYIIQNFRNKANESVIKEIMQKILKESLDDDNDRFEEEYNNAPPEVQQLIDEVGDEQDYRVHAALQKKLDLLGYDYDYGLDGMCTYFAKRT